MAILRRWQSTPLGSLSFFVRLSTAIATAIPSQQLFISIEGNIGAGKSTVMRALHADYVASQEVAFVDVREPGEMPPLECTGLVKVPFSTLSNELDRFEEAEEILFFCQSGARSQKAAQLLQQTYPDKKIFSIRGGINALKS